MSKQADQIHQTQQQHRLNASRPDKLILPNISNVSHKWSECKVLGKNITIRSYAAACSYKSELYVYGGFQILSGILSDFHKINLSESESIYQWVELSSDQKNVSPGPRAKHTMLNYQHFIILIGGITSTSEVSNQTWKYDIQNSTWELLKPKGVLFPRLEAFGSTIIADKIYTACGYDGKSGKYTNNVYQYDITNNAWSLLFESKQGLKQPGPRMGCAIASSLHQFYLFGGKQEQNRFNDLWVFKIETKAYQRIEDPQENRPYIRNGHTMNYFQEKLFIFGGIHEVTWQLDDLHIYNLKKNSWKVLQINSARRKQNKSPLLKQSIKLPDVHHHNNKHVSRRELKESKMGDTITSVHHGISPQLKNHGFNSNKQQSVDLTVSPGKMIQEQKKKQFMHKKAEMLKEFDVVEKDRMRFITIEPTSQAMRNSLDIIGNVNYNSKGKVQTHGRLTQFGKSSVSKFLQPLTNNSNVITGKRPCARDGHNAILINNDIVIFGGDRHQMSFNDIFRLNMKLVNQQLSQK